MASKKPGPPNPVAARNTAARAVIAARNAALWKPTTPTPPKAKETKNGR